MDIWEHHQNKYLRDMETFTNWMVENHQDLAFILSDLISEGLSAEKYREAALSLRRRYLYAMNGAIAADVWQEQDEAEAERRFEANQKLIQIHQ